MPLEDKFNVAGIQVYQEAVEQLSYAASSVVHGKTLERGSYVKLPMTPNSIPYGSRSVNYENSRSKSERGE